MLSRDLLLSDVWGYAYTGGTRTVDVHVRRLREKLPLLAESLADGQAVRLQAGGAAGVMRTVRAKLFVATFVVGALSALAVGLVLNVWLGRLTVQRIEQTLGAETRLAAEMLTRNPTIPASALDEEADRIGALIGVRVTFIAPDGRVLGDSTQSGAALAAMENHGKRPEIIAAARARGEVHVRRYSTTTEYDTLYAAIPITHPVVAYVRLALPLTGIAEQRRDILLLGLAGVLASLPIAALLSWAVTAPHGRPRLVDCRGRPAVRHRRSHEASRRLRRGRARRGRPRAGWRGAAAWQARERAGARSPAPPRDPLRHGRRRRGRGRPWPAGDGERGRARHAEARRRGHGPPVSGVDAAARDLRAARRRPSTARRRPVSSSRSRAIRRAPASPARPRPASPRAARSWCCTTSAT